MRVQISFPPPRGGFSGGREQGTKAEEEREETHCGGIVGGKAPPSSDVRIGQLI